MCQTSWKEAVLHLAEAQQRSVQSAQFEVHCNVVANLAGKKGFWRRALQLLDPFTSRKCGRNALVGHGITVDAYARAGFWDKALCELQVWAGRGGEASPLAFGAAARGLTGLAAREGSGGTPDVAWRKAAQLLASSKAPSVFVGNAVLAACSRVRLSQQALRLLSGMRQHGPQPDSASYNIILGLCADEGNVAQAVELLREARHQGVQANLLMYNLATKSSLTASSWQRAASMLLGMSEDSVAGDEISISTVIASCARRNSWRLCIALQHALQRRAMQQIAETGTIGYSTAASAAVQAMKWTHAQRLLDNIHRNQLQTDTDTFAALSTACMAASSAAEAGGIWSLAGALISVCEHQHGVTPDAFVGPSVSTFSRSTQWRAGVCLLAGMRASGIRPHLLCYNSVATSTWRSVSSMLSSFKAGWLEPDVASWNALLVASPSWEKSIGSLEAMACCLLEVDQVCTSTLLGGMNSAPWKVSLQALGQAVRMAPGAVDRILAAVVLRSFAALRSWQESLQLQASLEAATPYLRLSSDAGQKH